jgi:hypothetical protein
MKLKIYKQLIFETYSPLVKARYRTFQTKELSIIEYGKILFPHSYTGKGLDDFGVTDKCTACGLK